MDDSASIDESVETLDEGSLASFGSGNTTDSDKVSKTRCGSNCLVEKRSTLTD